MERQTLKSVMSAYGGFTIARDEKVILLKGAVPGEVVEVDIIEKKRDYSIAQVVNVIEPSEHRIDPMCAVFGICGGCQLQFISYEKQVMMKEEVLRDSLSRIGGIEMDASPPLVGEQRNYRHRVQFKVSREGEIGFFREYSRTVVPFRNCPLLIDQINNLFLSIREKADMRGLREVHLAAGDSSVVLLIGKDYDVSSWQAYRDIGISGIAFNDVFLSQPQYADFDLNGLKYTVSPWTFFQSHWGLNRKLVEEVMAALSPLEGKRILDLYAGAGNFSIPLAMHAGEVVAVEENAFAAQDGMRNVKLNKIRSCRFVRTTAEKYSIKDRFDVIILDPPRSGLTAAVVRKILESPADRIVYISCNPATLARDLKKLKDKYEVTSVRQVDFFPQTFHIEAVSFLRLR